jgi:hypothetical protein
MLIRGFVNLYHVKEDGWVKHGFNVSRSYRCTDVSNPPKESLTMFRTQNNLLENEAREWRVFERHVRAGIICRCNNREEQRRNGSPVYGRLLQSPARLAIWTLVILPVVSKDTCATSLSNGHNAHSIVLLSVHLISPTCVEICTLMIILVLSHLQSPSSFYWTRSRGILRIILQIRYIR